MLIDTHIHVGQFFNLYFDPSAVHELMKHLDVDYYAVSSTTQCEENYPKVLSEIEELIRLDGKKVLPIMWITPEALQGNIAWYMESDIRWRMLKVHPELHPDAWLPTGGNFAEVIEIARELRLPLLIHTGNYEYCYAGTFASLIRQNPEIVFILAHGRPLRETIDLLKHNDNAFADSAFMPLSDMMQIINEGLANKLLWGTDMCVPQHYYPQMDLEDYYNKKRKSFQQCCGREQYKMVTCRNACKIFNIKQN